jgi:hypothetical protein
MITYAILIKPFAPHTASRNLTRTEVNRLKAHGVLAKANWSVTTDGTVWDSDCYSVPSVRCTT